MFEKIVEDIEKYISLNRSTKSISGKYYNELFWAYDQKEKLESRNWRQLISNNTVCRMKYVPEVDKYHG